MLDVVTAERKSAVQIESPAPGKVPSDPPEPHDVSKDTRVSMSVGGLAKLVALVAMAVLAVAAILPNILPKRYTIATQTYVEEKVADAKEDGLKVVDVNTQAIKKLDDTVEQHGAILVRVETVQNEARASQEADRVTRHIRNGDRRVREYDRVYKAAVRNLKRKAATQSGAPLDPLEGVDLP